MIKKKTISIITICYNNFEELFKTYQSIYNYLSNEIEWVVIDGSIDNEISLFLHEIQSQNIVYICETDEGIYDAMNKGINLSSGEYLIFLNSGDTFCNIDLFDIGSKLSFDLEVFNLHCVDKKNNYLRCRTFSSDIEDLRNRPSIPHQSTFIKRKILLSFYNISYKYLADYDLFCFLFLKGAKFRFHKDIYLSNFECEGVTSNFQTSFKVANEMKNIQNKYFKKFNYFIYLQSIIKYLLFLFLGIKNLNNLRKK